jgi:ketosteroid isomerase-like protein
MTQILTLEDAAFERAWADAYRSYRLGESAALIALLHLDVEITVDADELLMGSAGRWRGPDGFLASHAEMNRDFDIAELQVVQSSAANGRLYVENRLHAFHRPTGKKVCLPLLQVWTHASGRVNALTAYLDRIETRRQIYGEVQSARPSQTLAARPEEDVDGNARRVTAVMNAFARGNFAPFWDLMDDEILWTCTLSRDHFPFGGTFNGKRELVSFTKLFSACFEVLDYEPVSMIRSGSSIVHVSRVRLRSQTTGESAATEHMGIWFFRRGKVLTYTEHFDAPVMRALLAGSVALPRAD